LDIDNELKEINADLARSLGRLQILQSEAKSELLSVGEGAMTSRRESLLKVVDELDVKISEIKSIGFFSAKS
jgi:hypothetical protein